MKIDIRQAVSEDIGILASLNSEVQTIHVSLFPKFFKDTEGAALVDWLCKQLSDPAAVVCVATVDGDVVGYLILRHVTRNANVFFHARRFAYIDQICVAQGFRRHGVGRALIAQAVEQAKSLGMDRMELDVWSDNRKAKATFEALGFATYSEKMTLDLSQPGSKTAFAQDDELPAHVKNPLFSQIN